MIGFIVAVLALLLSSTSHQGADSLRLGLRNPLGVSTEIAVYDARTSSELLNMLTGHVNYGPEAGRRFVLRSGSIYYLIPWGLLREAGIEGTDQLVSLSDGTRLRGRILTSVETGPRDRRTYDLSSATHVSVIAAPLPPDAMSPESYWPDQWELTLPGSPVKPLRVRQPRFAIEYYSGRGYVVGGRDVQDVVRNFRVRVGPDTVRANVTDFVSIAYWNRAGRDSVEVHAPGGSPARGTFVLPGPATHWLLTAVWANGIHIAVASGQGWTLTRLP